MALRVETLEVIATRLRKAFSESACGPLAVAQDVLVIAARWDEYKEEVNGISINKWLPMTFGKGYTLAWFQARAAAVTRLGEASRRYWNHDAAVWASRALGSDHNLARLAELVFHATKKNAGVPLSKDAVWRLARANKFTTATPRKPCKGCVDAARRIKDLEARLGIPAAAECVNVDERM